MSLISRLTAAFQAIGDDIKGLRTALNTKVTGETFLFDMITLPLIVKANMETYYSTPEIFNSYYSLKHNTAPFFGGRGVSSVTSTDNSPLDEKYETFTCLDSVNSFTLHLVGKAGGVFDPIPNKTYRFYMVVRGVGASIGKKITLGFYRPARVETVVELTENWRLLSSEVAIHDSTKLNIYTHMSGRGADLVVGEQMEVAALYIQQLD